MPIFVGNNKMRAFKGNYGPINIYEGGEKVAGWKSASQTGKSLHFDLTYNDTVELELTGETDQPKRFRTATGTSVVITNHASGDSLRMVEFAGNSEQSADKYREASGTSLIVDPTLHEKTVADKLVIGGTTVQKSDYYAKDGLITQSSNYYAKDGLSSQYVDTKTMGKNLFSKRATSSAYGTVTWDGDNRLTINGPWYVSFAYDVLPNTNYYLSANLVSFDVSSTVRVWGSDGGIDPLAEATCNSTFNTGNRTKLYIAFYSGGVTSGTTVYSDIQLELGTVKTAYEPYKDTVKSGLVMELSGRNFFNDPATITLQDRSGNGNVGTASGFQYRTTEYADRTADFTGKVSGSVVENPHTFKHIGATTLIAPNNGQGEPAKYQYDSIKVLDGNTWGYPTSASGYIPQQLFSFNVIAEFEKAYGAVPSADQTVAGKVAWLKANITDGTSISWTGYGNCPSGNKAYLTVWMASGSYWNTSTKNNTNSTPTLLGGIVEWWHHIENLITSDGFMHFLAYTDASDGVTASTIYTDYVKLNIKYKPAGGSDGAGGIKFDGVDDYVSVANNSNLNLTQTGGTVSAWYKNTANLRGSISGSILGKTNGYGSGYWLTQAETKAKFSLYGNTTSQLTSTSNINNGSWHHILATWDSISLKLYIDGVFDKSTDTPTSLVTTETNPLVIGRHFNAGELFNAGSISQVQVYNRALSASEVYQNYMAGANLNVPSPVDASPITSNLPAKTYKYTDGSDIYEFTLPEELRGIGTAVDKVVFDKVSKKAFVERRVGKKVFNGTETWGSGTAGFTNVIQCICAEILPVVQGGSINIFNSHFKPISGSDDIEHVRFNAGAPSQFVTWINRSRLASIDTAGFTSWLSANPMTTYYPLANVASTPITFTKVTSSPYTEVPMTFLTTTPDPLHPADLYSNLPTGSYKYTSTDGIYEFTLPEELRGIGTTYDKVVFDRVSHVGYLERRIGKYAYAGGETVSIINTTADYNTYQISTIINNALGDWVSNATWYKCTHLTPSSNMEGTYFANVEGLVIDGRDGSFNPRICFRKGNLGISDVATFKTWLSNQTSSGNQLAFYYTIKTVARTPLTFTKVTSSTKTEVPMTFLTNTPSLDYPASVLSVESGSKVLVRGKNLIDLSKVEKRTVNTLISLSGDSITITDDFFAKITVKVKKNTNYYMQAVRGPEPSGGTIAVYKNSPALGNVVVGNTSRNFVVNSGINDELIILFYSSGGTIDTKTFSNIQLEEGEWATAYEPFKGYQETTIPVTLKSIG